MFVQTKMSSLNYNRANLWENGRQNTQVFHWKDLLKEWNDTLVMPHSVEKAIDNLKCASDPLTHHNPSINDFLRYFNWEQEAIKWFLYECIAMRWMWGESRLDYVRDLIQEIDSLDSKFPIFPGSDGSLTIKYFLNNHLNDSERLYLGLMEPSISDDSDDSGESVSQLNMAFMQTPPRVPHVPYTPPAPRKNKNLKKNSHSIHPSFDIIIQRDSSSKNDDLIRIIPDILNDTYTIRYTDKTSSTPTKNTTGLTKEQVLNYLSITLRLLNNDKDPFECVQLIVPHMPTVILPTSMDSYTRDLIYDSLKMTMDNWPVNV